VEYVAEPARVDEVAIDTVHYVDRSKIWTTLVASKFCDLWAYFL
jgi:lipopolysaccharide biosynthesis glycosyltransferase